MDVLALSASLFILTSLSENVVGLLGLGRHKSDVHKSSSCTEEEPYVDCDDDAKYRSYDGVCNNLKNPFYGTPGVTFLRIVDATSYDDGACKPADLPSCRLISTQAIPDTFVEHPIWTLFTQMWGQYVAHDIALAKGTTDGIPCGCVNGQLTGTPESDRCDPIEIPANDAFYGPVGTKCFDFIRTSSTCKDDSNSKRAEQFNAVTSYLDVSPVYGISQEEADSLRYYKDGMLDYQILEGRMYPPQADNSCRDIGISEDLCIKTGDIRVNQNLHIGLLQIMFLRLHNDLAAKLCKKNSCWDDERCYQETRRIVIAIIQHITHNDFLPIVIGKENTFDKIISDSECFDNNYDDCCNVGVGNEFSTAAYRSLHSIVVGGINIFRHKNREHQSTLRLSDNLGNLGRLLEKDIELKFATGACTQRQQDADGNMDDEITQYFFRGHNDTHGVDLAAIDLCRGRDHGLARYIDVLQYCGLGKPKCWEDLKKYIKPDVVDNILKNVYKSYKNVELYIGGILETLLPGTLTGPTFNCLIVDQFVRLKNCDRYWYSYEYQPYPFTEDQLKSIKEGASVASLACRYISGFERIQRQAFEVVSDRNPLVDCDDIPFIDLDLWDDCC